MAMHGYNRFQYGISLGLSTLNEMTQRERRACGISDKDFKHLMFHEYKTQYDPSLIGSDTRAIFMFSERRQGDKYSYRTGFAHSPELDSMPIEESAKFAVHEASHSLRWGKLHGMKAVKTQKMVVGAVFGAALLHSVTSNDMAFDASAFAMKAAGYVAAGIATYKALRNGLKLYDEALAYKMQGVVQYLLEPHKPSVDQIRQEKNDFKKELSPLQKIKDFISGYPSSTMRSIFTLNGYEVAAKNCNFTEDRRRNAHYAATENLNRGRFRINDI